MRVIEQALIRGETTVDRLGIWDTNRPMLAGYDGQEVKRALSLRTIGIFTYTIIEVDMTCFPGAPGWPDWHHNGPSHKQLGRLFWNTFYATQTGDLYFHDAPDFSGHLMTNGIDHHFWGDIGQINALTWMIDVWPGMQPGDLWISIPDDQHQIILETQDAIVGQQVAIMDAIAAIYAGTAPRFKTKRRSAS